MKGLILNKGENGYSYFKKAFYKIDEMSEKYNWLISYPECYPQSKEIQEKMKGDYIWMSGTEVKHMLCSEDFQWIWGVLSGFSTDIMLEDVLKYPLPYADGYTGFWKKTISVQHPLADIELVAWDSTCTLFVSRNEAIIKKISTLYPWAEDLENYNKN